MHHLKLGANLLEIATGAELGLGQLSFTEIGWLAQGACHSRRVTLDNSLYTLYRDFSTECRISELLFNCASESWCLSL